MAQHSSWRQVQVRALRLEHRSLSYRLRVMKAASPAHEMSLAAWSDLAPVCPPPAKMAAFQSCEVLPKAHSRVCSQRATSPAFRPLLACLLPACRRPSTTTA